MDEKPKQFLHNPDDQAKEAKQEYKKTMRQPRKQKEAYDEPLLPTWFKEVLFWVLLVIVIVTYGVKGFNWATYTLMNNEEIKFTKEHGEYTKAVREIYTNAHKQTDEELMKALKGE